MSNEIRVVIADEGENFLGWQVERVPDGWHCRVWVLHQYDDEPIDPTTLTFPERAPDFEETLSTADETIDYLGSEDSILRAAATQLIAELPAK